MDDLISRKVLIADLRTAQGLGAIVAETLVRFVKKQPTVNTLEVVHGHMVERIVDYEYPSYKVLDCSECGCSVEKWHNYCPNCGAKMDGGIDYGSL